MMMAAVEENSGPINIKVVSSKSVEEFFPILSKCLQIFFNKYIYYYSVTSFVFWFILATTLLVTGLYEFSAKFWLKYGLLIMAILSMEMQLGLCLNSYPKWRYTLKKFVLQLSWDLTELPVTYRNKIQRLCKETDITFVLISVATMALTLSAQRVTTPFLMEYLHATVPLLETLNTQIFNFILNCMSFISLEFMSATVILGVYYWYYFIALTMIQLISFYHAFDDFQENCTKFSNRRVKSTLKLLIQRHQAIMELYMEVKHESLVPVIIITISLLIFGMFFILMLNSPYYDYKISIASVVVWGLTAFYFSYQGQSFEDLDEYLRKSLYNLNWYEWDISNRKMFRIFFLGAMVGVQQRTTCVQVNYEYFKQSTKFIYAIANLARQASSR